MKIYRLLAAIAFLAAIAVSPVLAQTKPAPAQQPAGPQTSGPVPDSKIALIYSDAFLDQKKGIARFNALMTTLNREFQPRQTEINQVQTRITQLQDDIEKTRAVADPKTIQQK